MLRWDLKLQPLVMESQQTQLRDGWGLAWDPSAGSLVASDGSDKLVWVDPTNLKTQRQARDGPAVAAPAGAQLHRLVVDRCR